MRRFRQTEMYHIQLKKETLMEDLRSQKEFGLELNIKHDSFDIHTCKRVEKQALAFIKIERKLQFILCRDWENQMMKSISTISNEHTLTTKICNGMVHCHNEGYKKTYDILTHHLHKLLDPFLGQVRKNGYYCKCGDTIIPPPKVNFIYGPGKFPPLKEQQSIILAFENEAQLIPGKPVLLKMQDLIDFILWKEQSTYNLIVQQIMTLTQAINKELNYDYNFPHFNELQKLQQPVQKEFKKLSSEYFIHSTILRPPIAQDVDDVNDRKWKTYLSKWKRGFQEPICICTCPACDYDNFYSDKVLKHPQGSWWAEQQIPRVLKCPAKSKNYKVCNIHDENFEFITETRTWSRIVPNKSK